MRHGGGPSAIYIVTYHRLEREVPAAPENYPEGQERDPLGASGIGSPPKPVLAESSRALIELLERIGVDFSLSEVRGAMEDIVES